jgi:hypothetical protein
MTTIDSGQPATTSPRPGLMSRERLAWTVILISFAWFVFFAITIPLGIYFYIQNTTVPHLVTVQGTDGTTLVEVPNRRDPVAIEAGRLKEDVIEQSLLRADAASQAQILLFDRSTVTIYPNSTVTISEVRRPRFSRSGRPNKIVLTVDSGRVRVDVAAAAERRVHFEVQTPHALAPHGGILLDEGSYAIESSNEVTHVSVRWGAALVSGQTGRMVRLNPNERTEIALGTAAVGPLPAARNLLVNSNFQNPENATPISQGQLVAAWTATSDQGGDGGTVDGTVDVVITGVTRALHFTREGSMNNHASTAVMQDVDKVVEDYLSVLLRLDVRVVSHSLSGGGEQSSEFPLIVRVDYQDGNGDNQHWTHGFYCHNEHGFNIIRGTEIPCDTRRTFEVNLKHELDRPRVIHRVTIYASGWDWDVYVSDLEMIAGDS